MNDKVKEEGRTFDLEDRLVESAVRVLNVVDALPKSAVGQHVAGQLLHLARHRHRTTARRRRPSLGRTLFTN